MSLNAPKTTNTKTQTDDSEEVMTIEGVAETVSVETQPLEAAEADTASNAESEVKAGEATVGQASSERSVTVTEARNSSLRQFTADQAAAGFEGLDVTGFSFPRIKLHEGSFKYGEEDHSLGESFEAVIQTTRRLYIVRQHEGQDAAVYYSYDPKGETLTDGSSADEIRKEWKEDGYGTEEEPLDIKEYLEAMAMLVNRDDEHNEELVMLSIPPTSRASVSGMAVQAKQRFGAMLSGVVLKFTVGKQRGDGSKKYRPWVMSLVGPFQG